MVLPTFDEEIKLWKLGLRFVAGLDEVGRGAWAGPLVVAAVVFPPHMKPLPGLRDSKLLTPSKREGLYLQIKNKALSCSVAEVGVKTIDRFGISKATQIAMRQAIKLLNVPTDFYLIDAFHVRYLKKTSQKAIKKGDQKCASIAAASVIAKVHRDTLMKKLDEIYRGYFLGRHKGYGTKIHQEAIKKLGLSPVHREVFIPQSLKEYYQNNLDCTKASL